MYDVTQLVGVGARRWTCMLSQVIHGQLCVTPWTVACQAPLSMGFSREECWRGLPCPPAENLPDVEIELTSLG